MYENNTEASELSDINDAISFFKPKDYFINYDNYDNEFNLIKSKIEYNLIKNYVNDTTLKLIFQQYYIVMNAYKLLIDYMNKTRTTYDLIIRLRFDQYIWSENSTDILDKINK